jgi:hypothetical protein
MRFRRATTFAAAAALSMVPAAAAHAATPHTILKVRSCQTGSTAKQRVAVFYGRMRAVPGTSRMMMRFTLVDHSTPSGAVVRSPRLARWHRSRPGVKTFGWAQTVTGLQMGGAYAALVDFRWVGADGKTIRSLHRVSTDCHQDGALPNLTITRVAARPGDALGTELYSIDVTNNGLVSAHGVGVDLFVDDAGADSATLDSIGPGATTTVRVNGPVCVQRVRAVVDRQDAIHETNEDDNVFRSRCPAVGG